MTFSSCTRFFHWFICLGRGLSIWGVRKNMVCHKHLRSKLRKYANEIIAFCHFLLFEVHLTISFFRNGNLILITKTEKWWLESFKHLPAATDAYIIVSIMVSYLVCGNIQYMQKKKESCELDDHFIQETIRSKPRSTREGENLFSSERHWSSLKFSKCLF